MYVFQGLALLWTFGWAVFRTLLHLPMLLLNNVLRSEPLDNPKSCRFYEGQVVHRRKAPKEHSFRYPVRVALVNLDCPPKWWGECADEHITAAEARKMAGTNGTVWILTNPPVAGYTQNPISVYYCYSKSWELVRGIAEVTNTPWGERVTFLFHPEGDELPKALHVSPLMDMKGRWRLRAPAPRDTLVLVVSVTHPHLGDFFFASLEARHSKVNARSECAGLQLAARYAFMPQRIALWIYWEAVRLLLKGVPFHGPPDTRTKQQLVGHTINPKMSGVPAPHCCWRDAQQWPWNMA